MTGELFSHEDDGATLLMAEEREGLRLTYITTRGELNEAEAGNIAKAAAWAMSGRRIKALDVEFLRRLHRRMLGEVWDWAGEYRRSDKNIGIPHRQIELAMYELVDNLKAWTAYGSYEPDEITVRFAHRLVQIHPFANGNGRHSRLAADIISVSANGRPFTWGRAGLVSAGETRAAYIQALKAADRNEFGPLIAFARS